MAAAPVPRATAADQLAAAKFTDATAVFRAAAGALPPTGGLLSAPAYDAQEAMNALELLDPKMDPGANKTTLRTVVDRLRDSSLPLPRASGDSAPVGGSGPAAGGLSGAAVLAVMDKLLQLEVRC
jgi:hypothetical protein